MPEYIVGKVSRPVHSEFYVYLNTTKLPEGATSQEAVTLPSNFVTVFHTVTKDLNITLPWPRPENYSPEHANDPFLIWGASSSVGMFALPILRYFGYNNLIAVASKGHHELLKSLGARHTIDYRDQDVVDQILATALATNKNKPSIRYIIDCIGSKDGSLAPLARIAQAGTEVAVMLPVIVKDSSETSEPEYAMDAESQASWNAGAIVRGVRTHFYLEVLMLASKLKYLANTE